MRKWLCYMFCLSMMLSLCACTGAKTPETGKTPSTDADASAQAEQSVTEWSREGYFQDENENMLSVTYMDDIDEPGWYVGCMLGEDFIEDSWGGTLPQEGKALHGTLQSSGSRDALTVTVSEEGE